MANDIFGGFGGLMRGLSGFMPQDDPSFKLMTAQTEVSDLEKQELELYAEIGKTAIAAYGMDSFGETAAKLKLVQSNLNLAKAKLQDTVSEQEAKEKEERAKLDARTCQTCGYENPEGTKFCQECGAKLGSTKVFCVSCNAELSPGTRFCGECGAKQPE